MVGSQSLAEYVIERCRSCEEMFELKSALVQFVIREEGGHESDVIAEVERLLPDVKERLQNRVERRQSRGEPIEYELVHEYVAPKATDDVDEIRELINLFGQESGWYGNDQRNRNFEFFVGALLASLGAIDVHITQFHNDGGYDVNGKFELGSDEVIIGSIQFRVEARNKSNTEINEVDAVTGVLEDGEVGIYVSRNESYSQTQRDRAHPRVRLMTLGQLIQASREDSELLGVLADIVPPDPVSIPTTSLTIEDYQEEMRSW